MKTNHINLPTSFFVLSCFFSGTGYGHGTIHDEAAHQQEDAFLAQQIREQEASGNAVLQKYFNHLLASAPVKTLLSEMVSAVVGEQVNAAVDNAPGLYGQWGAVTNWPFAFASAANLPDGRILAWGGNHTTYFDGGAFTYAAVWNPANLQMVNVNHPSHSMFCGTPVMLEDGRVFVAGGDKADAFSVKNTSTFNYQTQAWTKIQDMAVGRWYNGAVALPSGQVFSALGEPGSAYPEIWTPGTGAGSGWSYLNGASLQTAVLNYPTQTEAKNWLPHLHLAPNGKVFHSGHTPQMNYIDPTGNGSVTPVGLTNDWNTANTPSVLFGEGKILQTGGTLYDVNNTSTGKSAFIDINGGVPIRTAIGNMQFSRVFHNQVVLPNGEVMVIGGNNTGTKFDDFGSQMTPEIWNPVTRAWRQVADMTVPRNYHSVALLMTDGRVWSGGGGLCNCAADHPDSQVFSPPYLFNIDGSLAARPVITTAPSLVSYGRAITVAATPAISKFSLVRMSSTTHALNSDMRFLNVPFIETSSGNYQLNLHTNRNVMVPGYWMLFASNGQGVPSVAKVLKVSTSDVPTIVNPGDQSTMVNTTMALNVQANDPNGDAITFTATALPQGLNINTTTGVISGTPRSIGSSRVVISVTDGINTATVSFVWNIVTGQVTTATSSLFGGAGGTPFTDSVASNQSLTGINVRSGWWLDSIQGILNTGALPAHGGTGGNLSAITWPAGEYLVRSYGLHGTYVGQISFVTNTGRVLGPFGTGQGGMNTTNFDYSVPAGHEIIGFSGRASGFLDAIGIVSRSRQINNQPPIVATVANQANKSGETVSLTINATDPDSDALTYSATDLPAGLTIAGNTGLISGSPTMVGSYNVIVTVQDARGAISELNFIWTISAPTLVFDPIVTAPRPVGTVNLTANVTNATSAQYKWSFGDNTPETAYSGTAAVSHTYATAGLFTVRVTVKDANGITNTTTFTQAIHLPHTTNQPTLSVNMAVSPNRLWVVNQDNDTVSMFNTTTNAKVAEIAVGKSPRAIAIAPDGRIWVSNKAAATVSVINPTTLLVVQTINLPFASQPFGLVFAPNGGAAYVVLEATGKLVKLNPGTGAVIASLDVGTNPRHISIIGDSSKILVSRYITPALPGESTAAVDTTSRGGEVIVVDANAMTVSKTIILQHSNAQDTANTGAGLPNYLAMAAISPDGKNAWIPSKQDNIKRGVLRNSNNLNFQNTVRGINSKIDLVTLSEKITDRIDFDNTGLASAATFDRSGNYLFVALETSREVAIVDAYLGIVLSRIQVGLAPDGLVVSADGQTLYVNNFMSRTVSVVDLSRLLSRGDQIPPVAATLSSVATEKLAANVLKGKQLFYDARDPRLAGDAYLSCAACHNDGGHDGRVWDLTGFGEGLRNTIDLRGRGGMDQGLLHATGNFDEIQDFENQIRSLAAGVGLMSDVDFAATQNTLGTPKATKSADLDALAAYVNSLKTFAPSPYRNPDDSLTAAAIAGRTLFSTGGCVQCHRGNQFTDSNLAGLSHDVGTIKASSGKRLNALLTGLDTPTIRDVWNTAPYLHDGSAPTLNAAISAHTPMALSAAQISQVAAYIQQVGGSEPAPANMLPNVAITSPANGSTFAQGTAVILSVAASDSDGSVFKVEFYADNILLSTSTAAPYSFVWNNTTVGTHTLAAKAYDNAGTVASSSNVSINITANNLPTASPLFGSVGGTTFTDSVAANQSLTGVNVRSGWWLDSIQGILNAGTLPTHGGTGGFIGTGSLNAGEYLVGINGVYGNYVGKISFVTNTGRVLGPYGSGLGGSDTTAFSYTVPVGNEIIGFTGRESTYLNAIGVVYRSRSLNLPPVVAPVLDRTNIVGAAVSLTIAASDPEGDALTFAANGLPSGLTISSVTGLINGSPTIAGNYNVVATVKDAKGLTSTITFHWTINNPVNNTPTVSPLFGSVGGTTFTDSVAANQSLTGVNVRSGWWLDSIQGILNAGTLPTHGGTGGFIGIASLSAGEYLVGINGVYGNYVGKISFVTNTGRVLGPYGSGLGGSDTTAFSYTVPVGSEIIGFTGRESTYLNAIGVVYRTRQ
jgi:large repetitive protein